MTNEDEQVILNWAKQHLSYCSKSHGEDYLHTPDCRRAKVLIELSIDNNALHALLAKGSGTMTADGEYHEHKRVSLDSFKILQGDNITLTFKYQPWKEQGITELEYYKNRYMEMSIKNNELEGAVYTARKNLEAQAKLQPGEYLGAGGGIDKDNCAHVCPSNVIYNNNLIQCSKCGQWHEA